MTDLIRRSDALAACQGMDPEGDINNLPAVTVGLPTDCRKWPFYPIQMPTTKDGKGPATIGVDAASVSYEVWDWEFNTYASFEHLPDAINEAVRLSLAALEPVAAPDNIVEKQEAESLALEARAEAAEAKVAALVEALTLYSCEDGCNDCPAHERDRVNCGFTARAALAKGAKP